MATRYALETKPYQINLEQLEIPAGQVSGLSRRALKDLAVTLKDNQASAVLPVACVTDDEDKYHLLTGFDIVEAARAAELAQIWVFVIAVPQTEAGQWMATHGTLSKLNDSLIEPNDVDNFIKLINDTKADMTMIPGIGHMTADKVAAARPYKDLADVQSKLGKKRPLNWIRAYKNLA
ncbi:hypothetical protein [Candidatus Albibeggiatoa sp. nov. NOAA]|uniref:hypothetical protein n=1 Tax=Candidatus Albibeggiatoa sp. nov. NOAA TaxID=3162724 RepID=UPI0032FE8997|nr:hypothetical protein [Thiotrichaceae bacterium]